MKVGENRSDVESELESEDPTEVGHDMIFSKEEESWEVVATSAERRDPMAASASGKQEAERRGDVPVLRKHATSPDTVGEWDAKRTRSSHPSEASLASSPPIVGTTGQARQSGERAHIHALSGLAPVHDPQ